MMDIDDMVYSLQHTGKISNITDLIDTMLAFQENLFDPLLRTWTDRIVTILTEMSNVNSSTLIQENLLEDLKWNYVVEYDRLNSLVPLEEFCKEYDWSIEDYLRKVTDFHTLNPVHIFNKKALLTKGQCERILMYEEVKFENKIINDLIPIDRQPQNLELLVDFEGETPSNTIYDFYNNAYDYLNNLTSAIWRGVPANEVQRIIDYISTRISIIPELYFALADRHMKEGNLDGAFEAYKKVVSLCDSIIPPYFEGKIADSNNDYYQFSMAYLSYFYCKKGYNELALDNLLKLQKRLTLDWMDNEDGIELLRQDPNQFLKWFEINYMKEYEELDFSEHDWISGFKVRPIDINEPNNLRYDRNYARNCEFQVDQEIRVELVTEHSLFQNIVPLLVVSHDVAFINDPLMKFSQLSRHEGGLIFKDAAVAYQNDGVVPKTTVIPMEEQNLIYPLITAQTINKLCDYFVMESGDSVRTRLINAAKKILNTKILSEQDFIYEINKSSINEIWSGFFRNFD